MIRVKIISRAKEIELKENKIIAEKLIRKLGFSPDEVVVVRNGEVITEDDEIYDGDFVEIIPVASGG